MSDTLQEEAPARPSSGGFGPAMIKVVRVLGWTFIWTGLFLLGFVFHQLYVTTWFAQQGNDQLAAEAEVYFEDAVITEVPYSPTGSPGGSEDPQPGDPNEPSDPAEPSQPSDPEDPQFLLVEEAPPSGQPFAIIRIPTIERLELGWTVVEGVSRANLKNGAGHMPSTPLPGQPGNSVISGHRTTYGAPFHELEELQPGQTIEVDTALGTHVYEVRERIVVRPTELWVTGDRPGSWLTLTTCHPKFSSRQRLIVFAELVDGPNHDVIFG